MRGRWTPLWIIAAVMGLFAVITSRYYTYLPDRMATHFGADGFPNGWMLKSDFVWTFAGLLLFVEVATTGIGVFLHLIPTGLINLPNRDYWLSPERRATSLSYIRNYSNWMGAATGALMIAMGHAVYRANIGDDIRLGSQAWLFLGIFMAFMVINTIGLVTRFGRPR